jgi:(p)ppGpp synthase/HD superfamily hydrolase
VLLTVRFNQALTYAAELHGHQTRKHEEDEPKIPYIAHLMAVCALVLQDEGTEDEAIAALLHDAAEDQGGEARLREIEDLFGEPVSEIVRECSDTFEQPKPPWRERKERYIAHLGEASPSALRVSLADKLDNARAIVSDYRRLGDALWARFNPEADQLWYYRALVTRFREIEALNSPMLDEFDRVVAELESLTSAD